MSDKWQIPPSMKRRAISTRKHLQHIEDADTSDKELASVKLRHAIKVGDGLIADQDDLTAARDEAAKARDAARKRGEKLENHPPTLEDWFENIREIRTSKGGEEVRNSRIFNDRQARRYMLLARNAKLARVVSRGEKGFNLAETCKRVSEATPEQIAKANVLAVRKDAHRKKYEGTTARVTLASFEQYLGTIHDGTVDLLITDPPYETDVDDIYSFASSWVSMALDKLNDTGRAYICIGAYPRELHAYIGEILKREPDFILDPPLVWTYKNTLGPTPAKSYKQNWQAILHVRRENAPDLATASMIERLSVHEINAPDGRLGDRFHTWQKPDKLAERLIRHAIGDKAGAVVIDPFCCTGTFVLAAAAIGCIATGCDIDAENLAIATDRGCIQ